MVGPKIFSFALMKLELEARFINDFPRAGPGGGLLGICFSAFQPRCPQALIGRGESGCRFQFLAELVFELHIEKLPIFPMPDNSRD